MTDQRRHVLCIDDDRDTAGLIAEELVDRGFKVSLAFDGEQGFQAILDRHPDLVLADISMPHLSGFDLLERLTAIAAGAAGDPELADRTWVLLTEASDGGWGLAGHANTNEELVLAARAQIASLQAGTPADPA